MLAKRLIAVLFVFVLAGGTAKADMRQTLKGVALVIGQSKYEHLIPLTNPGNDAEALSRLLGSLGFAVTTVADQDARRLRRSLENFTEDAQGADVALIYYSGHGIEAGGENWLIPTDADPSSLWDAEKHLVPISRLLNDVRRAVPITLLFLDACRTNPFPAGAMLKSNGKAVPVSAAGLGETKGAMSLGGTDQPQAAGLGSLIGFAAEPGQAALDGPAGGNSPYAAALLRHLAVSAGTEFGTVMRMVTQEVYLKTNARQRPWVNETLTRLLYFGGAGDELKDEKGRILTERRRVLLTIAELPDAERRQVEATAAAAGVPMDALYGLLSALGADIPKDPADLDRTLKAQTEAIKARQDRLATLVFDDGEIERLVRLADEALAEGALDTNASLMDEATRRYEEIVRPRRDKIEAEVKASHLEGGALYARAAEAYQLKLDFLTAARNYREAHAEVEKWDAAAALDYKRSEAKALFDQGNQRGDKSALHRAVDAYTEALALSPRDKASHDWAKTQNNLANVLWTLGRDYGDVGGLEGAITAYRAALEVFTRAEAPYDWALIQGNLANVLQTLGERETGTQRLAEAVTAYRASLEERTRDYVPLEWAATQKNLGAALATWGNRENNAAKLEEAVAIYREALEESTRERVPLEWARTQNNLGNALAMLGYLQDSGPRLEEAVAAYRAALEENTRERALVEWARTQINLGIALKGLGSLQGSAVRLKEAAAAYRAVLEEGTRERVPLEWARAQNNLASALLALGKLEGNPARLEEAVAAYRGALEVRRRDRAPLEWAQTQSALGNALQAWGERDSNTARRSEAVEAWREASQVLTRERDPSTWARLQNSIGYQLILIGETENNPARLETAVPILRNALDVQTELRSPSAPFTQDSLCRALLGLGKSRRDRAMLMEAKEHCKTALEGKNNAGSRKETEKNLQALETALQTLGNNP